MSVSGTPAGYRQSAIGGTLLVARDENHDTIRNALANGSLHRWAAAQPGARALHGRDVAWATQLGDGTAVVVRHSRHGGMLAGLTGDLFLAPTRAPRELDAAVRLQAAGVPTPAVVAYAVYSAFGPLCRADVVTGFVEGDDFPVAWAKANTPARDAIIDAVAALLRAMQTAGAHHPDLNAKNVLIAEAAGAPVAFVLDIDRVTFERKGDPGVGERNARRFGHSLMKPGALRGLDIGEPHWRRLGAGAGVVFTGQPVPPRR